MVLSANDKNNGGGYSIEDILEEVRRMRKDQTRRPDNADRLKRNSADHGPALHDTGNINKMPAKDMPQDAGTKLNKPSDSNIGNTHNNVHKSQTDIQRGKSIPEHKSISNRLDKESKLQTSNPLDSETSKNSISNKNGKSSEANEPPKTGIRRLDRFLISGGSRSWDGNASNNIAPHALTPDELMKSVQRGQGENSDKDKIRRNDNIIRRAALDGLIDNSDSAIRENKEKNNRTERQKKNNLRGQLPQESMNQNRQNNLGGINGAGNDINKRISEQRGSEKASSVNNIRQENFIDNIKTDELNRKELKRDLSGNTQAFSIGGVQGDEAYHNNTGRKKDISAQLSKTRGINLDDGRQRAIIRPSRPKIPAGGLDYGLPLTDDNNDYETISDAQRIRLGLDRKKSRFGLRAVITFILFCASALLSVFDFIGYPFDGITPSLYLLINIAVLAAAVIVNITDIIKVFRIFILKATAASASALAVIAALANAIVLYFTGSAPAGGYQLFTASALLALFFTVLAEYINISRARSNFEIIANIDEKNAAFTMDDEYAQELAGDEELGSALVCGVKKAVNIRGFLKNSFKNDPTDSICNVLVPVILLVAIVAALMMSVLDRSATAAITVFTSIIIISVPLSSALLTAMQLSSASKRLREEYGTIVGYSTVEQYKDVNAVMMDSTDLFPWGSLHLHSIKNFGTVEVDKSILMSAAAAVACGGTLADLFDSVIEGRHSILPKVDAIRYESGLGIVSTISGAEIKLGSREMMEHYSIPVPSAAAERKIKQRGAYALYLSVGKNLAAMFIVSYDVDEDIMYRLNELIHVGANLIIHTRDPLINSEMLGECFKIPENCVRILDDETGKIYRAVSKPVADFSSTIIGRGNIASVCHALVSCFKLHGNISFGKIAQLVAIIMAAAVALFVSFNYGVASFGGIHLLIYQLICALIIIGGTSMRRT